MNKVKIAIFAEIPLLRWTGKILYGKELFNRDRFCNVIFCR